MANFLNFKFGAHANLPPSKVAGTVYVTTDEQAMYIDLPNKDVPTQIDRLRIGDIIVKESVRDAKPPFAEGAFYYFTEENALLRWNGTEWKQINSLDKATEEINKLTAVVNAEVKRSTEKDAAHDKSIADLETAVAARVTTETFEAFKTQNTKDIADAKAAGTGAQATANQAVQDAAAAQLTANTAVADAAKKLPLAGGQMSGGIDMKTNKITNVGTPTNDGDAVNKKYVDDAKADALDAAEEASLLAGEAKDAGLEGQRLANAAQASANAAQSKADSAYTLAESKVTMAQVEAKDYATKTEAQGYANAVLGQNGDASTVNTVYGAKKAAAEALSAANAAQATANSKVTMAQVEAKDYATKAEAQGYANNVLGSSSDLSTANTVYGAKKAAAEALEKGNKGITDAAGALTAAQGAQSTANTAVGLANAAQEAAENAHARANEAYDLAEDANENANTRVLKSDFETFKTQNTKDIADAKSAGTAAQATANSAVGLANDAQSAADDAQKAADDAMAKALEMLPLAGGKMTGAIDMNSKAITNLPAPSANGDAANKKYVDDAKSAASQLANAAQATANSALGIAQAAMPKAGGAFTGDVAMGNHKITGLAAPADNADATNKKYVDDAIAAGIKANDAMTFKGTVGGTGATVSALPSTAQKGDTYKVAAKGTYANVAAKVGDLFINVAADDAAASWTHISSGYEDDYLQKFAVANNVIHLTDGVTNSASGSVGSFTVVGDAQSNMQFAVTSNGNNHTITGSMVWGEF